RMIPFEGADVLAPLPLGSMPGQTSAEKADTVSDPTNTVKDQTVSIVTQAASILDEEMAKGVLDARRAPGIAPQGYSSASNPLLGQVHDLVDNLAGVWPSLQNVQTERLAAPQPAASTADALAELRPRESVRPGQRATVSMTLCNSENRVVRLT